MIYFDNNATTRIAPEVVEAMSPFLTDYYGNPSSAYSLSTKSKNAIDKARETIADLINASSPGEIVFTSGGTESDNWAIFGTLEMRREIKPHIISTLVEHEAVRKVCEKLEFNGFEVSWLEVDENGLLDLDSLKNALRKDTTLVSIMLANNETGVLFPVKKIAEIVKEHSNAVFHVDGVNAVGKVPIDLKNSEIDLFSISGHKFHAPKGVGALYIRDRVELASNSIGGGQETGRRAGTEATHQIVGLGEAAKIVKDFSPTEEIQRLRDRLENEILQNIPNSRRNGAKNERLPNTANISFEGLNGEAIMAKLDDLGVCVSTGSACNEENQTASPVLHAMNVPFSQAMGSIRFSLGRYNTEEEVDYVSRHLPEVIADLKKIAG